MTKLHPDYPVVEGHYQMADHWSIFLPAEFNKRIEEGDLVIWRPGMTLWLSAWANDNDETQQERLEWIKNESGADAYDIQDLRDGPVLRYSYRLDEDNEDDREPALYGFVIAADGHVQIAIYFDRDKDTTMAYDILNGIMPV